MLRFLIVEVEVGPLLGLFKEKFVEDVLDIDGADVFQVENLGRQAVIGDGLVQFLDHFFDARHLSRRSLHDQRVAAAIGYHAHLFAVLVGRAG